MDAEFWQSRWREDRIGFHQDRPTPLMERHWPALGLAPGARVFVPLCGKSLDMAWLAGHGFRVLGVELAEKAVHAFFDEHGLVPEVRHEPGRERYMSGAIEIVRGDAFALDEADLAGCDAVFDRAALIALPANLRERYARELYAKLPRGCRGLLVTLEYPQHEKDGPPFSVPGAMVQALFGHDWAIERVERLDILATQPGFVAEGVTDLHTAAYRLQRR